MLKPKPMKKIRIIVLKSVIEKLIKDLHEAGVVDIRNTSHKGLEDGRPLSSFDDVSAQLLKLRSLISVIESNLGKIEIEPKIIDGDLALEKAHQLDVGEILKTLNNKAVKLSEEIAALESKASVIEKLLHFKEVDFSKLETKTLKCRVGTISMSKMAKLNRDLEVAKGENSVVRDPSSDTTLVFYEKEKDEESDAVLSELGFNDIEIPEGVQRPAESIDIVKEDYERKKLELEKINAEIVSISKENINEIVSLNASLQVVADRASITNNFSSSKKAYVVEGWITAENFDNVKGIIEKYNKEAVLEDVKYAHNEMPPTVLNNKKIASPFEYLTNSYSLPNYYEIDPTMTYFIFLPIIYGMIVGDFFYGIASIVLGYLLMQKFKKSYVMSNISKIWFYSGFPTMIFGILFDEYGGMSHFGVLSYLSKWLGSDIVSAPLYVGFSRIHNVLGLLALTVLVGMVHLGFGFALGAINEWKHNKKHAIAKIAWIGVEVGMLLALLGAIGMVESAFTMAGLVVLIISIVTLAITEGIMGIIELPGLVGNILSYTRIAAIGIVGIIIAELLNDFIIPLPEQGILAIILLPIFLVFHVINAFIAMFESLVQGGRLNIVEFRSKFLHGGGELFSPFKMR